MSSTRRKLPPPPLVIRPVLVRLSLRAPDREKMLELGRFLHSKRLLTDGGIKNLELGFVGRNRTCSLSTQDVRGWAQSLVLDLWSDEAANWADITRAYFERYDKQKPRRPNHLQRLYLEWSPDFSWPGLLRACRHHPMLWERLEFAVEKLHEDHPEKSLLCLALKSRYNLTAFDQAVLEDELPLCHIAQLLGCLDQYDWVDRLRRFEQLAARIEESKLAYHFVSQLACPMEAARLLPPMLSLARVGKMSRGGDRFHDVNFLCGHRVFISSKAELDELFASIHQDDPIRCVRFGPRPGTVWLDCFRTELEELIELRSATSFP